MAQLGPRYGLPLTYEKPAGCWSGNPNIDAPPSRSSVPDALTKSMPSPCAPLRARARVPDASATAAPQVKPGSYHGFCTNCITVGVSGGPIPLQVETGGCALTSKFAHKV